MEQEKIVLQEQNSSWSYVRTPGSSNIPYDPFEPDLIHRTLEQDNYNMGKLIFGQEKWKNMSQAGGLPEQCGQSPLLEYFSSLELRGRMYLYRLASMIHDPF